jgi:hypothetical protein
MDLQIINRLNDEVKVGFVITIAEKVFSVIDKDDERYIDGRNALDKCWLWAENNSISGDELYGLIDNPECTGISEFAEDEEDLDIARVWSLLVDVVSYTSWKAYKKEKTKYLPQALEGIKEDSILVFIESAVETTFITKEELDVMEQHLMGNYQTNFNGINRSDFIRKVIVE